MSMLTSSHKNATKTGDVTHVDLIQP